MSHWANRWSMLWNSTQRVGRESIYLISTISRSPTTARDILVGQARQANSVATSLLRLEREYGLLRYHGVRGYMQQLTGSAGATDASSKNASTTTGPTTTGTKARVAFMITASQKDELGKKLGFSSDQIKRLKPIEASLILEHGVKAEDHETELPDIMDTYEKDLQEEAKQAALLAEAARAAEVARVAASKTEKVAEEQDKEQDKEQIGTAKLWYEVVESNAGNTDTIGLFRDEAEAKFCVETKAQLAAKHTPDEPIKFEIRTTRR